jgi:hypothetical protein
MTTIQIIKAQPTGENPEALLRNIIVRIRYLTS